MKITFEGKRFVDINTQSCLYLLNTYATFTQRMTIIITTRALMFIYITHTDNHFIDWHKKLSKHYSLENDKLEPP